MREEFEKLEEIKLLIDKHKLFYCKNGDWYLSPSDDRESENFVDGAWYAYRQQQSKIDAVLEYVRDKVKDGNIVDSIEEILK